MTAPLHSRDIKGKGRYYGACSETCPLGEELLISVTNAQGVIAKPQLVPAAAKATAEKAWAELPRMVATSRQPAAGPCAKARVADRCGHCRFCLTAEIKAEHRNQWERAADFGTAVHDHAHAHVLGEPRPYVPEVQPFVNQHLRFLDEFGVNIDRDVEAAETTVFSRKHRYAGTGDLWVWLRIDPATGRPSPRKRFLWLVDIKTSLKKPVGTVYVDQVLQLAGLKYAEAAILPDDSEVELPRFDGAALLNLRADDYRLIPLPADRAAHRAFVNAVGLQTFLHTQDTKTWTPIDAPAVAPARKAS
ncbi:hypothetical protein [Nocardioides bruguierae]|uniref:hypothetical protein n=1 Tax=Nocardioides bruguierae TaxID=2945102 RepID=UPI002021FB20|nr:hypothetical protein [Nocardioides bruguierae]MCL8026346.1 hypothetical protein [Nocardioides bruguierae]